MPRIFFVLPLLALAGCLPGPSPYRGPSPDSDPAPYVGCYQATFHDQIRDRDGQWRLRLYPKAAKSQMPGGENGLPARRAWASLQRHNDPFWRLIPAGIQFHSGDTLHGFYTEFAMRGDSLVGRAFYYSDVQDGFITERVSAHRVPCTGDGFAP